MRNGRGQRLAERRRHHVESRDRAVIGLGYTLGGVIPVHRVGDERDGAFVVIDGRHIGGEQEQQIRQPQIIDCLLRKPLQPTDDVIGQETDHAAGQRREVRQRLACQQVHGGPQRIERIAPAGSPLRGGPEPGGVAVAHRQGRG